VDRVALGPWGSALAGLAMLPVAILLLAIFVCLTLPAIVVVYLTGVVARFYFAFRDRNLRPKRGEVWDDRGENLVILSGWPYVVYRQSDGIVNEGSKEWAHHQLHRGRYRLHDARVISEQDLRDLYDTAS